MWLLHDCLGDAEWKLNVNFRQRFVPGYSSRYLHSFNARSHWPLLLSEKGGLYVHTGFPFFAYCPEAVQKQRCLPACLPPFKTKNAHRMRNAI